jgi:N-acetylmuramoyl-L-alanine amidase
MKPYRRIASSLVLLAIFAVQGSRAAPPAGAQSLGDLYLSARSRCNEAMAVPRSDRSRAALHECVSLLEEVERRDTEKKLTDKCDYLMGLSHQRLFELYRNYHDLDSASKHFEAVSRETPETAMASNAEARARTLRSASAASGAGVASAAATAPPPSPEGASRTARDAPRTPDTGPRAGAGKRETPSPRRLEKIVYWSKGGGTARVVLYFNGHIPYIEHAATTGSRSRASDRGASVDFENLVPAPGLSPRILSGKELVKGVRIGRSPSKGIRVMLDTKILESHRVFSLPDPFRVVIDVCGKKPLASAPNEIRPDSSAIAEPPPSAPGHSSQSAAPNPPAPSEGTRVVLGESALVGSRIVEGKIPHPYPQAPPATGPAPAGQTPGPGATSCATASKPDPSIPDLTAQLGLRVKCIVLDPGHGGRDKGAIGADGVFEKDVVLDIARELGEVLSESTGCRVILTRTDDSYVSLEERTAIANAQKADLFVSIHTNAHRDKNLRGVETYFLDLSGDNEAARVAALENATSTKKVSDLEKILRDLMLNTKLNESNHLALDVQQNLIAKLQSGYERIKDLGVKKAPFYVLLGAEMPSVLVETAFLTNGEEAERLKDKFFQRTLVEGIASGIESYMHRIGQDIHAGERQ